MRTKRLIPALAALATLSLHAMVASAQVTITEVFFDGPDEDNDSEPDVTLNAVLYAPDGFDEEEEEGVYQAVVMMHGCSGMWSSRNYGATSGGAPNLQNHIDRWGIKLANEGIVALAVDSFTPRTPAPADDAAKDAFQSQCNGNPPDAYFGEVDPYVTRALDALAGYDYLASYPQVDADHVGMLGWSQGAEAVMVQAAETFRDSNTSRGAGVRVFTSAVVYYPGCGTDLGFTPNSVANTYWRPYTAFRMNIGTSDGLYSNCDTRMDVATGTSWTPAAGYIEYEEYTSATHSFDNGTSQSWPTSTCSGGASANTCAQYDSDIDSYAFFVSNL